MSNQPKSNSETLPERTGMRSEEIFSAREQWRDTHPMRRILIAEINRSITEEQQALETCAIENLKERQGTIRALRKVLGLIESQKN